MRPAPCTSILPVNHSPGRTRPLRRPRSSSLAVTLQSGADPEGEPYCLLVTAICDRSVAVPSEGRHLCRPCCLGVRLHRYGLGFRFAAIWRLEKFSYQKNLPTLLPSSAISRPSTSPPACRAALRRHVSVQSRSRHTSSAVTNRRPAGITSNPAATLARLRRPAAGVSPAWSPRRNTSETAFPTDCFDRAARTFAVRSTSSSRSRVVLIAETQPHLLRSANHD